MLRALSLSLLLIASSAQAGWLSHCADFFARFQVRHENISAEEARVWTESFGVGGRFPYISALNDPKNNELFWYLFKKLPLPVQERLHRIPPGQADANRYFNLLESYYGGGDSYLRQFRRTWERSLERSETGTDAWIASGLHKYETALKQEPALAARLEKTYLHEADKSAAISRWHGGFGAVPLPLLEKDGKTFIQVAEEVYAAKKTKDGWILQVPREKLAHPSWNPLSAKTLTAIAQKGVAPPKVYETALGHDGKFYLLDGNHRFELDRRKLVPVRLPDPPSTLSFRLFFDMKNMKQPDTELLVRWLHGEIPWEALLESPRDIQEFRLKP